MSTSGVSRASAAAYTRRATAVIEGHFEQEPGGGRLVVTSALTFLATLWGSGTTQVGGVYVQCQGSRGTSSSKPYSPAWFRIHL